MTFRHKVRTLLWRAGYDVSRFRPSSHPLARRRELLRRGAFDVVLDVGANSGQFGLQLRELGFSGRIVSFEPVEAVFESLEGIARRDGKWTTVHCALGAEDGEAEISVSGNSFSSSLLEMLPAHLEAAPQSAQVRVETIKLRRLDSLVDELCLPTDRIFLKLDVQGFERQVLMGAIRTLPRVLALQLEMSISPLYAGETPFWEMHAQLQEIGFELFSIEPGFSHPVTGRLLQMDGIYIRPESKSSTDGMPGSPWVQRRIGEQYERLVDGT